MKKAEEEVMTRERKLLSGLWLLLNDYQIIRDWDGDLYSDKIVDRKTGRMVGWTTLDKSEAIMIEDLIDD